MFRDLESQWPFTVPLWAVHWESTLQRIFRGDHISSQHHHKFWYMCTQHGGVQANAWKSYCLKKKYRHAFVNTLLLKVPNCLLCNNELPRKERLKSPNSLEIKINHKLKLIQFNFFYFYLSTFNILATCEVLTIITKWKKRALPSQRRASWPG